MIDASSLTSRAADLAHQAERLAADAAAVQQQLSRHGGGDPFIAGLTVFVLACFVGYYVVWKVTPALHTPLMSVTNAISGIIIVGAVIALGAGEAEASRWAGFAAVTLASVNIFGGFIVTRRMLEMFHKKDKKKP